MVFGIGRKGQSGLGIAGMLVSSLQLVGLAKNGLSSKKTDPVQQAAQPILQKPLEKQNPSPVKAAAELNEGGSSLLNTAYTISSIASTVLGIAQGITGNWPWYLLGAGGAYFLYRNWKQAGIQANSNVHIHIHVNGSPPTIVNSVGQEMATLHVKAAPAA
jgi:hypothetical protein